MADEEECEWNESQDNNGFQSERSVRQAKKNARLTQMILKNEKNAITRLISNILKKVDDERTVEENDILAKSPELTKRLIKQAIKRESAKSRHLEIEDPEDVLQYKCQQLAAEIQNSSKVIVYTGAGISTAASIPDYRGPNGVWTLLQKGQQPEAQDLSDAEPTITHMCITQLYRKGHVKHVVSQNCDGLHLRSGFPCNNLSEVHGNMYIELCNHCKPHREYIRLFDVTEKTGVRRHGTDRNCHVCGKQLRDTIVHFGEKGGLKSPYRWKEATKAANNSEIILCLGTSLRILKKYPCLWCMDRRLQKRPKLYIVNLQWTPKDETATLKINGRCDNVMKRVLDLLNLPIPAYKKEEDPIFLLHTPLKANEKHTFSKKILKIPKCCRKRKSQRLNKNLDVSSEESPEKLNCDPPQTVECPSAAEDSPQKNNVIPKPELGFSPVLQSSPSRCPLPPPLISGSNGHASLPLPFIPPAINALMSAHHFQQISSHFLSSLCDNCKQQLDPKCCCHFMFAQGFGAPPIPGFSPYLPFLPYSSPLTYTGMGLPFSPPPMWQYPSSSQGMFQPPTSTISNNIQSLLNDHCYLKKAQMQQLSPRSDSSLTTPSPQKYHAQKAQSSLCNEKVSARDQTKTVSPTLSSRSTRGCSSRRAFSVDQTGGFLLKEEQIKSNEKLHEFTLIKNKLPNVNDQPKTSSDSVSKVKVPRLIGHSETSSENVYKNEVAKLSDQSETSSESVLLSRSASDHLIHDCSENETADDTNLQNKKRKFVRSTSVPGWFGKGLNLKKKKRF